MQIGDAVKYVDEFGVEHDGLVTAVHGTWNDDAPTKPSINVVYVSPDRPLRGRALPARRGRSTF